MKLIERSDNRTGEEIEVWVRRRMKEITSDK